MQARGTLRMDRAMKIKGFANKKTLCIPWRSRSKTDDVPRREEGTGGGAWSGEKGGSTPRIKLKI